MGYVHPFKLLRVVGGDPSPPSPPSPFLAGLPEAGLARRVVTLEKMESGRSASSSTGPFAFLSLFLPILDKEDAAKLGTDRKTYIVAEPCLNL